MNSNELYVVMICIDGWYYAPCENVTFFKDREAAMDRFKKLVKEMKEDGGSGSQTKIFVARVKIGEPFYFAGYGEFVGGKIIKARDFDE